MPGVQITTDTGLVGSGFCGTHAHLPTDRLITDFIEHTAAPLLHSETLETVDDIARLVEKIYRFPPAQWVGRFGITHLGLAAIDIALWDLAAKAAERPLWAFLTEMRQSAPQAAIEAYNTDGGWLNLSQKAIVENCRRFVETDGFRGVKLKVGKTELAEDLERVAAVRAAIGPNIRLMVDANGKWGLERALEADTVLHELGVQWVEEPMWYDDLEGHRALAAQAKVPVALGEQLYSPYHFRDFINAGALYYVQPDVTRLAGISEWLSVADAAHAAGLPVAAHAGDMSQIHVHTSFAHPACVILEYIPWIQACFVEPALVRDGHFVRPELPGVGTTFRRDADRFCVQGNIVGE
jgi:L-alanine-DL-glutamate epimerase-like enolase superfamily enzyme